MIETLQNESRLNFLGITRYKNGKCVNPLKNKTYIRLSYDIGFILLLS